MTLEIFGFSEKIESEVQAVKILRDGYEGQLRRVEDDLPRSVRYDRYDLGMSGWGWQFAGRVYGPTGSPL